GVNTALVPQVLLASGLAGRAANAADWFHHSNLVSLIGSCISAAGILVFFVNMALSFLRRPADWKQGDHQGGQARRNHTWRLIARVIAPGSACCFRKATGCVGVDRGGIGV